MADLPKSQLDLLLLSILASGPKHGYAIIDELRARSEGAFDLPEGTIYPALHRLEAAGSLTSSWDAATARRRRVYRITARGRRTLERQRNEWAGFSRAVALVVEGAG